MIEISKKIYKQSFERKKKIFQEAFGESSKIKYFPSPHVNFRYRTEFGLLKLDNKFSYAMTLNGKKEPVKSFLIVSERIQKLMQSLLNYINEFSSISKKLFQIEFQSARNNDAMITLIYHRNLDKDWYDQASKIASELDISVIGRSKKQILVVGNNYITENYKFLNQEFTLRLYEQCFSQTNPYICDDMLDWVSKNRIKDKKDIVELHCGLGTFTIPLSTLYEKVLATENSRPSFRALQKNISLNQRKNISCGRLSGRETIEALTHVRPFRRLSSINLREFEINNIFLDPPREGLDQYTRDHIQEIENIIYISCGFEAFKRDLSILRKTHDLKELAMFDQFPYTNHIESGAILRRKA